MRRLAAVAFVLAVSGLAGVARADDKSGPSGTWKWSAGRPGGGQARETTLKLKVDGDKVTGTISARGGDVAIEDGTYKDGEISFKVTRMGQGGQSFTQKFHGKISGDEIKGKMAGPGRGGQTQERDWVAKRAK
jgi:hypothetical protein